MHLAAFTMLCWLALPAKLCHAMNLPAFPLPLAQVPADSGMLDIAMKAVKELGSIALAFLYCIWVTVKIIPNMAKEHNDERQRWEDERKRWEAERVAMLGGFGKTLEDTVKHCAEVNARHP
jgi:hypothetical protein